MSEQNIVALYCDGGVIAKNPSPIGGTWAWCGVNAQGIRVIRQGGVVPAIPRRPVTNNHTEQIAITKALEAMPDGWSGIVHSDSYVALGRFSSAGAKRICPATLASAAKPQLRAWAI